jgi:5'-nucleotidase
LIALMNHSVSDKLVVGVASSALFDLGEADRIFRSEGTAAYRAYQRAHEQVALQPGVAFPFVKQFLGLNGPSETDRVVEVVLLSKNDPDTGLRVFNSAEAHGLDITRASFVSGGRPFDYLEAYDVALFLSANEQDVRSAIALGAPAGLVHPSSSAALGAGKELRVAFDFDGVIGDDSCEAVFKAGGLAAFQKHEVEHGDKAIPPGPFNRFFRQLAKLQAAEQRRRDHDPDYRSRIRTAIITARGAPAHRRVVTTLRDWGVLEVDEVHFLDGMDKASIVERFRPHIFFDDQISQLSQ